MIQKVTTSSKMEVETRVSVQAMRGKFEQKPLETPGSCIRSPPAKTVTPPYRQRTSSLISKEKVGGGQNGVHDGRPTISIDKENESSSKSAKQSSSNISKTKSIISEIVSPMLSGSKKALSPKKHSVENIRGRKASLEKAEAAEDSLKVTPSRKVSETLNSDAKPSVVRRIPVFKSHNGGLGSEERTAVQSESSESQGNTVLRRDRFFGHIRSRSHGNFMIKRDSSAERNGGFSNSAENGGMNFFDRKNRQKSSDNLYANRDAKSSSPFEGKQKLVANVVKNMKDRPKVLRKFSFSSKVEKDIKNKKEKATPNKESNKHSPCGDPCTAKMEALAKAPVSEKHLKVPGSSPWSSSVSLAKAVADIALEKSSQRSPESVSKNVIPSEEASPPARPPRRRSGTPALLPHKKGMAPTPPGPPAQNMNKNETENPESTTVDLQVRTQEQKISQDNNLNHPGSANKQKSLESLIIQTSSTSENSTPTVTQNVSLLQKNISKSSMNVSLASEEYCTCDEEEENDILPRAAENTKSETNKEQLDIDSLPTGPPPKKPPRTFAYDIYKSTKESKNELDVISRENPNSIEKLNVSSPASGPIYAIPQKKKKTENRLTPKPPMRSNSDLTNKDLNKPSVAPKPPHILNKAVRTSVVDPLSCTEKGEEAAMTTEFQRQAHVRYSLRRPKKPPPAPPASDLEGETQNQKNHNETNALTKSNTGLSTNCDNLENENRYSSTPQIIKDGKCSPENSFDITPQSRCSPDSIYESLNSDDTEDSGTNTQSFRMTSRSSYNLHVPSGIENNQPLSLGHCPTDTSHELTGLYRKRSMSDETLYKGSKYGEEPIYAMPIFANGKGARGHDRQRELHYMCSVLFTNEEADAGRDGSGSGRKGSRDGDALDKGMKSSIISAWKKEFRQSCRQVQNRIKKTVNR